MKDWPTIITAIVALYGAILSTVSILSQRKDKKRQILVKLSNGFLTFGPELSPAMLFIEASNPGHIPVNINSPGIILPDKRTIVFPSPQGDVSFPHSLPPGENCRVWTDLKQLSHQLLNKGVKSSVGFCSVKCYLRCQA